MISKGNRNIETLTDWEIYAGPKSAIQWKDGRSAKEAAKYWLRTSSNFPLEISKLLAAHRSFSTPISWQAEPESAVCFDSFRGEPANIDVLVRFKDRFGDGLLLVEAKADETFGATIRDQLKAAFKRLEGNPRSKGVARLEGLVGRVLGIGLSNIDEIADLRYQLLTVTAAAISESERTGVNRALVLVQEFVTDLTNDDKHASNASDLNNFLSKLDLPALNTGDIVGPTRIRSIDIYFRKLTHNLRINDFQSE